MRTIILLICFFIPRLTYGLDVERQIGPEKALLLQWDFIKNSGMELSGKPGNEEVTYFVHNIAWLCLEISPETAKESSIKAALLDIKEKIGHHTIPYSICSERDRRAIVSSISAAYSRGGLSFNSGIVPRSDRPLAHIINLLLYEHPAEGSEIQVSGGTGKI